MASSNTPSFPGLSLCLLWIKPPDLAVTNSSCGLEAVSSPVQIPATWRNCPLWNSGVRGQPSVPIFVTSQSSVSWWQLCYPDVFPYPLLPHFSWSPGKNHLLSWLSEDFFFFKYQFPFVLRQPPIRAEVCRVWRKAGIVFRAPGGKVVHLLFFLIRFPAILQESQRLQLLPSAVNGGPPCLRTYMLIIWQGEKKKQNKNSKKKLQPSLTKVFLPVSIHPLSHTRPHCYPRKVFG